MVYDVFELWCWKRLLRVPWLARRSNQSILKEISPEYSLEGLMLKLKLQYFGHLMWRTVWKDPDAGRDCGQEEKGMTEHEMAGWHHGLDGHESEWAPGDGDGQGGLACCDSWGRKELDTTECLNWTELVAHSNLNKYKHQKMMSTMVMMMTSSGHHPKNLWEHWGHRMEIS